MDFLVNLFLPKIAYASLNSFVGNVNEMIINPLIILLFALALMYFVYGIVEFLANGDNEEKKTSGKSHMLWGVVGLTVMLGVWAILGIILSTFNITYINPKEGTVNLPPYNPPTSR